MSLDAARYMLDADAFNHLRAMAILQFIRNSDKLSRPILLTEFIARHELSQVQRDVVEFERIGLIRVEKIVRRGKQDEEFRRLRLEGADKGEAEAIAWALMLQIEQRPLFISVDHGAQAFARKNRVPSGDVMDFLVDLVGEGVLTRQEACDLTFSWQNQTQQRGRPPNFTTFDEVFDRRNAMRGR